MFQKYFIISFRAVLPSSAHQQFLEKQIIWKDEIDQLHSEYKRLCLEYRQTGYYLPPDMHEMSYMMRHQILHVECGIRDNTWTSENDWLSKCDSYLEFMNLKYNELKVFVRLELAKLKDFLENPNGSKSTVKPATPEK